VDLRFPESPAVSTEAQDFIRGLLVKDPLARMSLADVPNHPWIQKNADPSALT
jgi:serine/threonine protein kinase